MAQYQTTSSLEGNQRENQKTFGNKWELKYEISEFVGYIKSSLKRKVYIFASSHQERRKRAHINNWAIQLKKLENDQKYELKAGRRKDIIKFRAKIYQLETQNIITKDEWKQELVLWKQVKNRQTIGKTY